MDLVTERQQQTIETIRVLIADDDAPTRILLKAAVSQWGYQVVEAKDGLEAWDIMSKPNPPRLLILDWLMPGLDGIALCEKSKKELNTHPYIILLTQVTGTVNIIKGLEAGADEFLTKPFNMAELRSRLGTAARIIRYEWTLTEQNKKFHLYIDQIQQLADLGKTACKEIESFTKEFPNARVSEEMKKTCDEMQKIIEVLKEIPVESKQ